VKILMLFIDGVGIGRRDPSVNPLFLAQLPAFRSLCGGDLPSLRRNRFVSAKATVLPLDATLGVPGLPQSGTGQTALFTGVNGARIVGRHFGPYPYSSLRPIIAEANILRRLNALGLRPCFANAFPERFFRYMENHETRLTVTTRSSLSSGIPLRTAESLARGEAVSADITGEGWRNLGHPEIPVIDPAEAGRCLVRLLEQFDFVLFEYWHTDRAGHSRNLHQAVEVIERFDRMLGGILAAMDFGHALLLVTSDHGNVEDLSVKTHTRNPVPLVLAGLHHSRFAGRLSRHSKPDLTHVVPAILDQFA
jgi:2,3-bisphosphoglycerate-independent phosphoglycerate mutase